MPWPLQFHPSAAVPVEPSPTETTHPVSSSSPKSESSDLDKDRDEALGRSLMYFAVQSPS
jgi:hypothetical protein